MYAVEVAGAKRSLHLLARSLHLGERLRGAPLRSGTRQEGLQPESEGLDLLELFEAERGDARAAAPLAHDQALAFESPERVTDRRQADLEPGCELFEAKALAGRELEPSDLLAQSAVDTILDGRNLERGGQSRRRRQILTFDQRFLCARTPGVKRKAASG